MARLTTFNFEAAKKALWQGRLNFLGRFSGAASPIDKDFGQGDFLGWVGSDANGSQIKALAVDSDNRIQIDQDPTIGQRSAIELNVPTAGALVTQTFYTARIPVVITSISLLFSTAESAAGTSTLAVFKDSGVGTAPGGGSTTMVGTFNLKATANTIQLATLLAANGDGTPAAGITLAPGDRLSAVVGGAATITALAGVVLAVGVAPGGKDEVVQINLPTAGSVATQAFFLANRDYVIVGGMLTFSVHATGAPAITVDITQETTTGAPGAGTTILSAVINVSNTAPANTPISIPLTATAANLIMRAGNRLSIKANGSMTGIAGFSLSMFLQALGPVGYIGQEDITITGLASGFATQGTWIADRDYEIVDFSAVWSTASGGGGTLDLTVDKGVVAPGAGLSALSATIALSGTANTVVVAGLNTSRRQRMISQGDLVSIKVSAPAATAGLVTALSLLPR